MINTEKFESRLRAKLEELQGRRKRVETDLDEPLTADFEDQVTQTEDDESQEAEDALIIDEIDAVKAALSRIKDGSYGECIICGSAISEERLEAIPEAALCIECARKAAG